MMKSKALGLLLCILSTAMMQHVHAQTSLIATSATWKYFDAVTPANIPSLTGWQTPGFNDASWSSGPARLGYGQGGEGTVVSFGPNSSNKYVSTYFRKTINITNPAAYLDFTFRLRRDDGIVIYVNGVEVRRDNMPAGTIAYNTLASTVASDNGANTITFTVPQSTFIAGANTIAAEVHQANVTSSDIAFVLDLTGNINTYLIPSGSSWKYLVAAADPGFTWADPFFNDLSWPAGNAEFGYGDGGESTILGWGADADNKYPTTYFRKKITIPDISNFVSFSANLIRDDGAVVYVNGVEVGRNNMPAGPVSNNTLASTDLDQPDESTPFSMPIPLTYFVQGENTIAVEIHQSVANSPDLSFNMELLGNPAVVVALTRGPYLQMGNKNSVTLRWRTDLPCNSRVEAGPGPSHGIYPLVFNDGTVTTEHIVQITGLSEDHKYFYRFGSSSQFLQVGTDNFFRTAPPSNTNRKIRVVAFGDCGRGVPAFQDNTLVNYQNYLTANGIEGADLWLLLGDNAYENGTDDEYRDNFFTPYQSSIMKNHILFPSPGNHDYANNGTRQSDHNVPYFENFTVPFNGESGGTASTVPRYYSYDWGDIHFLSLDSYGEENAGTTRLYDTLGAQVTWVKNDLANNTKKWVVAYWHHPPYTMSTHNSDNETDLRDIRTNFIRILERSGVDMVICGHAHAYERSYLLKGHYGLEPTFSLATHAVSNSSGKYDGSVNSCPYITPSGKVDHGIVYIVAGSTGANGTNAGSFPHDALPFSDDDAGVFYFEVQENRLDAKYLRRNSAIPDQFTIIKDANRKTTITTVVGQAINLTSSWPGSYNWQPTGQTALKTISITPSSVGTTTYYVKDALTNTCLADTFIVNAAAALPVNLLEFTAKLKNNKVFLDWTVADEVDNNYFSIERSGTESRFVLLNKIKALNAGSLVRKYAWVDEKPLYGLNYYRLSQSDKNGTTRILGTRKITYNSDDNLRVWIAQDNGQAGIAAVRMVSKKVQHVSVSIVDANGSIVKRDELELTEGLNSKNYSLKAGIYVIEVKDGRGARFVHKIVVLF